MVPGVVLKVKYNLPGSKKTGHSGLVDYIDRDEAVENKEEQRRFDKFTDYMNNEFKSSGLFNEFSDSMSKSDVAFHKKKFREAEANDGIMWDSVISFTDEWLIENKILVDGVVNDDKIREATKNSMAELIDREKMIGNVYWMGAIHYNTGNLHVHMAMVEKNVHRTRGKFKPKSLESAKAKVVSTLMDRSNQQMEFSQMRDGIIKQSKEKNFSKMYSWEFKKLAKSVNGLQYGRLSKEEKAAVDKLTSTILKKNFPAINKKLMKKLDAEEERYRQAYGDGKENIPKRYKANREAELQSRLGNVVLRQLQDYKFHQSRNVAYTKKVKQFKWERDCRKADVLLKKLIKEMDYESEKAIAEYERMKAEAERENER
jgi:hypothetical protein